MYMQNDEASQVDGENRPPIKKLYRGASFIVEEDNLLISISLTLALMLYRVLTKISHKGGPEFLIFILI